MMTGFEWGMGLGGWLWMIPGIVLLILLVWAVVAAIPRPDRRTTDDATQVLKARFARGEITQAEYEQARRLFAA